MDKFSDLTNLERSILLEYVQSGIIPSDLDIEKYDKLILIMKKLSVSTRRSRVARKSEIDILPENTLVSKLVDDIIFSIPDKSETLILTIPSLKIKAVLTDSKEDVLNLPSYISSVTIEGVSISLYVYPVSTGDGVISDPGLVPVNPDASKSETYYVIDSDTDPKVTLFTQDAKDLVTVTAVGSYTSDIYGTATVTLNVGRI